MRETYEQAVERFVRQSCEAQGIPVKVIDPHVIHQVAVLLGASTPGPSLNSGDISL